jgi:IS5 family transposase
VLLERVVDWGYFEREWSAFFTSSTGRPATSPRLIAGLFYLQHMYGHSAETVLTMFLQPSFTQVIVDTKVKEKAITHPTDAKLLEKSRCRLVKLAKKEGINLRQNDNRVAPRQAIQTGRYAHAKQYACMKKV